MAVDLSCADRALRFVIPGPPVPCGRSRPFLSNGRMIFTMDPKTRAYEQSVCLHARSAAAGARWELDGLGPFGLGIQVYRVAKRGDADNYAKGIKDGMTKAGIWRDDRYVEDERIRMYVDKEHPRVVVEVYRLGGAV